MKRCFIYAAGTFYGLREPPRGGRCFRSPRMRGFCLCRAPWRHDRTSCSGTSTRWTPPRTPPDLHPRAGREGRHRHHAGAPRGTSPRLRVPSISTARTGGARLDHTLANLQSLAFLLRHGARGYLYDQNFVYTAIENETLTLAREVDWGIVSLFSMGDRAEHITLEGLAISAHGRDDRLRLPARCEQSHRCADSAHYRGARAAARRLGAAEIGRGGVKFSRRERQSRSVGWHSL